MAVIDIGATSVRMQIAQINTDGTVERLESLSQAMSIGKDSFMQGYINRRTIEECSTVLLSYRKKLEEYGVDPRAIRAVATSGVREASNRLAFQDRIYVATGFEIEPLDPAELHRVTYLGVYPFFQTHAELFENHSAICEVGGGATELLLLKGHDVIKSNSLRLGSLRLRKMLDVYDAPQETARVLAESQIKKSLGLLFPENDHAVDTFISMGSEIRMVAADVNPTARDSDLVEITMEQLEDFVQRLYSLTANQIASQFLLPLGSAQTFGPALLTHMEFVKSFNAKRIMVASVNLRDSLIQEMVSGQAWSNAIQKQICRSAILLGQKFDFQQQHAEHVAKTSLELFDQLSELHNLDYKMRAILETAALLHEIGKIVNTSGFHKHSSYLISNSEFFGVGEREHSLIALVARYHRRALPQNNHVRYSSLDLQDRISVSKLAAILRIANAMDESHRQKIMSFKCNVETDQVTILADGVSDISLEQHAVRQTKSLFENIFGMSLSLHDGGA